jgi:hypothetical protein
VGCQGICKRILVAMQSAVGSRTPGLRSNSNPVLHSRAVSPLAPLPPFPPLGLRPRIVANTGRKWRGARKGRSQGGNPISKTPVAGSLAIKLPACQAICQRIPGAMRLALG